MIETLRFKPDISKQELQFDQQLQIIFEPSDLTWIPEAVPMELRELFKVAPEKIGHGSMLQTEARYIIEEAIYQILNLPSPAKKTYIANGYALTKYIHNLDSDPKTQESMALIVPEVEKLILEGTLLPLGELIDQARQIVAKKRQNRQNEINSYKAKNLTK